MLFVVVQSAVAHYTVLTGGAWRAYETTWRATLTPRFGGGILHLTKAMYWPAEWVGVGVRVTPCQGVLTGGELVRAYDAM